MKKLCNACKHFKLEPVSAEYSLCLHPNNFISDCITGAEHHINRYCQIHRMFSDDVALCGIDGKWFEPND